MSLFRNKAINRTFFICLGIVGIAFLVTFVVIPVLFRLFPSLLRSFIFVPDEEIPENVDYKHPENSGFFGGKNFYLTTNDGAKLGVWHTLPSSLASEARNLNLTHMDNSTALQYYNDWLADATVFLYLHGSAGTRTSPHRLRVYHLLNKLNYHVVTFDYRGYGDSTLSPLSESNLIEDTMTVFSWIRQRVVTGNIFIWGHSLGTGVGAHAANEIQTRNEQIKGIILEAPFSNIADVVRTNEITNLFSFLPWFNYCFIQPLYKNDLSFESDRHLRNISTPVLILHAKDDKIIPYEQATKLYETVADSRKDPTTVRLIGYDANLGYGHYNITLDPNLNVTFRAFVDSCLQKNQTSIK